jgi:hypothetical protein
VRISLGVLLFVASAVFPEARKKWTCADNSLIEWCDVYHVHNPQNVGGGGSTEALPETVCEGALVGVASWASGPSIQEYENDGYDEDEDFDYAESSTNAEAAGDSSFYGIYWLYVNHWYVGNPAACNGFELPPFADSWDIT